MVKPNGAAELRTQLLQATKARHPLSLKPQFSPRAGVLPRLLVLPQVETLPRVLLPQVLLPRVLLLERWRAIMVHISPYLLLASY